jgi:hypothetical protein
MSNPAVCGKELCEVLRAFFDTRTDTAISPIKSYNIEGDHLTITLYQPLCVHVITKNVKSVGGTIFCLADNAERKIKMKLSPNHIEFIDIGKESSFSVFLKTPSIFRVILGKWMRSHINKINYFEDGRKMSIYTKTRILGMAYDRLLSLYYDDQMESLKRCARQLPRSFNEEEHFKIVIENFMR